MGIGGWAVELRELRSYSATGRMGSGAGLETRASSGAKMAR